MEDVPVLGVVLGVEAVFVAFVEVVNGEVLQEGFYLLTGVVAAAGDGRPRILRTEKLGGEEAAGREGGADRGPCGGELLRADEGEREGRVDEVHTLEAGARHLGHGEGFGAGLHDRQFVLGCVLGIGWEVFREELDRFGVRVEREDVKAASKKFAGVAAFAGAEVDGEGRRCGRDASCRGGAFEEGQGEQKRVARGLARNGGVIGGPVAVAPGLGGWLRRGLNG